MFHALGAMVVAAAAAEVKVIESALTDATAIDVESELDITMFHHGPSLDSITLLEARHWPEPCVNRFPL